MWKSCIHDNDVCGAGSISPGLCGLGMHDRYIEENLKEEWMN